MLEIKSLTQIAEENHIQPNALNEMRITAFYIAALSFVLGVISVYWGFALYKVIDLL